MVFVLIAAIGLVAGRWLNWFSVAAIAIILAVAVGIEGAVHARPFLKVLRRCFEMNSVFQGAYLAQAVCLAYGPYWLRRPSK
ncbi:hypothetical protein MKK69_08935 [Methylobacterium sp. J-026]|uniref:hypothetical protein n=1 Tax=Methylobacterium sp. J-026 TaxID=2836624 RepID=UPI001FB8A274|nr:hypothetical protein [Methylobacterium sp. J-026]MCJ2134180.1 hypothetical protein [Methylobacterium sp. J-026]